jgi:type I restriction enzyme S subunit
MSWEQVKIQDIFDVARGGSPRPINSFITEDDDGVNWIMIGDTKGSGKYITKTAKKIKPEGVKKSREVKEGDFLLTNSMSFGRPYILKTKGCIHDGWLVLSPVNENIHTDYFYYYLGSNEIKLKLSSKAAGAVVKNLNKDIVKNLKIPLPPLATQKKIAAILDEADSLRQLNKQLIEKYDALTQSLFLDMFGDPVTNPKGFNISNIGSQCVVKGGKRVPKGDKLVNEDTGYPYIKAGNIKKGKITTLNLEYLKPEIREKLKRYIVNEGDVCITVVGINIGDIGVVPKELHLANLTENANKLLIKDNSKLSNFYLSFALQMNHIQQQIKKRTMAVGVPKLALFRIQQLEILIPPIELQNEFAARVQLIEQQKQQAQEALQKSENLFNSLLQKAFKGELVN